MESQFKVVIIGDAAVGKTAFVRRHMSVPVDSEERYTPTLGVDVYPVKFTTNYGHVTFAVWDTAGQEKLAALRDGYYAGAHAAIIMFDVSSRVTYKNVSSWYRDIERICPNIPVVLCGNKVDVKNRQVQARSMTFHRKKRIQYFDMSARANFNIEKPFLWLARTLTQKPDLVFQGDHFKAPELSIDEAHRMQLEKDPAEADDDDDDDDEDDL